MDFLNLYILFWVLIFGLCLGSFYNVVILRSLSEESIVFPPSKCPKCQTKLKPWHNIPLISYMLLRGKCAFCKEKISIQYPLIELVTAILFVVTYLKFGLSWNALFAVIIISSMLIMATTDIKEKLVDCNIAIGLGIIGLLFQAFINNSFLDAIYGILAGIIIMETLARIGYLFTKDRAFGEADTYIAAALGACFGLQGLGLILMYTLCAAMFFIIPVFIYKQYQNNNKTICILFILFILSALGVNHTNNVYLLLSLAITGVSLAIAILKNLRTEKTLLYFPLVPAFACAVLYHIFF